MSQSSKERLPKEPTHLTDEDIAQETENTTNDNRGHQENESESKNQDIQNTPIENQIAAPQGNEEIIDMPPQEFENTEIVEVTQSVIENNEIVTIETETANVLNEVRRDVVIDIDSAYEETKTNHEPTVITIADELGLKVIDKELSTKTLSQFTDEKETVVKVQPRRHYWVYYNGIGDPTGHLDPRGNMIEYTPDRNVFVQKVFAAVLFMILGTAGFCFTVYFVEPLNEIFHDRTLRFVIMMMALIIILIMYCVFACSYCSRIPPFNIFCLFLVAVGYSLLVAVIGVAYRVEIIFYAFVITALVFMLCLVLACTSFDFTRFYLYLIVAALAMSFAVMFLLIMRLAFHVHYKPLHIAVLLVFTLINCVGMIMELQMILGGRTIEIGEDDYALAAYMLYSSVVTLFLQILQLLGLLDS